MDKGISVIDTGYYVPENVLTNDDLSKIVDTSDEWIYPRTGIKKRHMCKDETLIDMAGRLFMIIAKCGWITGRRW